jgi:5-methylcytosine-specific restriction endonuclease McrA
VLDRDHGICAICGADTLKMARIRVLVRRDGWLEYMHLKLHWKDLGMNDGVSDFWQADHIVPRVRGGTNDIANIRTVCEACHKIETANLAADRAAERRDAKRPLLQDIVSEP